jgi:hypothetical protein
VWSPRLFTSYLGDFFTSICVTLATVLCLPIMAKTLIDNFQPILSIFDVARGNIPLKVFVTKNLLTEISTTFVSYDVLKRLFLLCTFISKSKEVLDKKIPISPILGLV